MSLADLHTAIKELDGTRVNEILRSNADVNVTYGQETALTQAIYLKADAIITSILDQPYCDVNAVNQFDRTPLYFAALGGLTDLVKTLLERGSDVNRPDIGGSTPLSATSYYDHSDIADILIKSGASLNCADNRGETPLSRACSSLSLNVVEILLKAGSNIECKTNENKTALIDTVLANDNDKATEKSKRIKIMTLLLENGANPDVQNDRLYSALHYAAERNDIYAACLLMEHGCDFYLFNNEDMSTFDVAIGRQHFYLAVLFFLNGFRLTAICPKLIKTILSKNKYIETDENMRQILLSIVLDQAGAITKSVSFFVDVQTLIDETMADSVCLEMIERHSHLSNYPQTLQQQCRRSIRTLLARQFLRKLKNLNLPKDLKTYLLYGFDICYISSEVSSLFMAIDEGLNFEIKRYLEKDIDKDVVYDSQTPLMRAAMVNNIEAAEYLLSIEADCNYSDYQGNSILHVAANSGHIDIVKLLMRCGKCAIKANARGNLPFNEAVINGHIECAVFLLNYCCSTEINKVDQNGIPPLHYAVGNGSAILTSSLLQKGACVNQLDVNGNTALHVAGTKGAIYLRENIELPALFSSKLSCVLTTTSCMMCDVSELKTKCCNIFKNQKEILSLLLEAGVDNDIPNNNLKKAADLSKEYGFRDVFLPEIA